MRALQDTLVQGVGFLDSLPLAPPASGSLITWSLLGGPSPEGLVNATSGKQVRLRGARTHPRRCTVAVAERQWHAVRAMLVCVPGGCTCSALHESR